MHHLTFYKRVCLHLFLEILDNMCIAIVCFPGFDVINFEINFIYFNEWFLYMTETSRQKFRYIENKRIKVFRLKKHF